MLKTVFSLSFAALVLSCQDPGPSSGMTLPAPSGTELVLQGENSLLFTWEPVVGAGHYYVSLEDAEDGSKVAAAESVTETGVLFEGVGQGVTYYCRIRAVSADGYAYSDFVTSNTVTVPAAEPESDTGTEPGTDQDEDTDSDTDTDIDTGADTDTDTDTDTDIDADTDTDIDADTDAGAGADTENQS